jgi:hypothetical protein
LKKGTKKLLPLFAALAISAGPAPPAWQVEVLQLDKTQTLVGKPNDFTCGTTGCEQNLTLEIDGKPQPFLLQISFVPTGAYVAVQPQAREIGKAIDFEKGFEGPVFVRIHNGHAQETLRVTLTGAALDDPNADTPQLMQSSRSLVFHRKLEPDLTLRMALSHAKPSG